MTESSYCASLVTHNQHVTESKSRTDQSRYLTQPTNPLVSSPALIGRYIIKWTDFGGSHVSDDKDRDGPWNIEFFSAFHHLTQLLARENFIELSYHETCKLGATDASEMLAATCLYGVTSKNTPLLIAITVRTLNFRYFLTFIDQCQPICSALKELLISCKE